METFNALKCKLQDIIYNIVYNITYQGVVTLDYITDSLIVAEDYQYIVNESMTIDGYITLSEGALVIS